MNPELNILRQRWWFGGFPCGSAGKESACNAGDLGSIPGLGRSPGEGNGYPFQYSGLENSRDCIVHGVAKSHTQMSDFHVHTFSKHERTWISKGRYYNLPYKCYFSVINLKNSPSMFSPRLKMLKTTKAKEDLISTLQGTSLSMGCDPGINTLWLWFFNKPNTFPSYYCLLYSWLISPEVLNTL